MLFFSSPWALGKQDVSKIPEKENATFNYQYKDTAACRDSDFFAAEPILLNFAVNQKKCYITIKLIESQQLS